MKRGTSMKKQLVVMLTSSALALGLGLGCGKDKDKDKGKSNKGKGPKAGKTTTAKKGGSARPAFGGKSNVDLDKVINTEKAVPFGAFKADGIKLGMTKEEVAKINPKYVDVMRGYVKDGMSYSARSGRAFAKGDKNKFKIHTLVASFYAKFKYVPWKDVRAKLDEKWGKPIDHADFNLKGATSHFWFNPEKGIRAMLNGYDEKRAKMGFAAKVRFQQYMPLDKWLGAPGKPLPLLVDGKPLIGMSADDVEKAYHYRPKQKSASALPYMLRTEWDGDQPPAVMVWVGEDDKVNKYTISLKYKDHPKGTAPFLAAIKAKWPGKNVTEDGKWAQVDKNVWVRHNKGWKAFEIQVGAKPAGA
jgi:hypothetical protein